jgi:hypothetical protein
MKYRDERMKRAIFASAERVVFYPPVFAPSFPFVCAERSKCNKEED